MPFLAEVVSLAAAGRTTFRGPLIVARCDFALRRRLLPTRLVQLVNFSVGERTAPDVNLVHRPGRKVHVPPLKKRARPTVNGPSDSGFRHCVALLAALAPVGRLLGYKDHYPRYSAEDGEGERVHHLRRAC